MAQETGFPALDALHPLDVGEVRLVLGDHREHVGGLLRSVVLSVAADDGTPCTLVTVGRSIADAHRALELGFVGTADMRDPTHRQCERMRQILGAPLQVVTSASLEAETLTQKLGTVRSPVVVVDECGAQQPASRRAASRSLAALRAWARSRDAAVLYASPPQTRFQAQHGWNPRQVTWNVLPPREGDDDRIPVEVRRGARLLGRDELLWVPSRRLLANEARTPRVVTLPNGLTVTIERLEDHPSR